MNPETTINPQERKRVALAFGIVIAVAFLVFSPAIFNDFVDWDDTQLIVQNPRFNPPAWADVGYYWTHVTFNLYQPITCTVWAALAKASYIPTADQFGSHINPYLFHLASVLFHSVATGFLFLILQRIFKSVLPAALGATVFAIHPVQVEAVALWGR